MFYIEVLGFQRYTGWASNQIRRTDIGDSNRFILPATLMIEPHLRQLTGIAIQFAGLILITVGVSGPGLWFLLELKAMWTGANPGLLLILQQIAVSFAGIILAGLGARLLRIGKRAKELPADELLMIDKRAPVLYLRSFQFDDVSGENIITTREISIPFPPVVLPPMNLSTYEGVLAGILNKIGPCITVGFPGTTLQVLGFSRLELAEDKWQIAVKELMKDAALVLICSGRTAGVRWELEQAVNLVALERLVILITHQTTENWWQMADGLFQTKLPRIESGSAVFGGIITFDKHGTPRGDQFVYHQKDQTSIKHSLTDAFKPIFVRLQGSVDGN